MPSSASSTVGRFRALETAASTQAGVNADPRASAELSLGGAELIRAHIQRARLRRVGSLSGVSPVTAAIAGEMGEALQEMIALEEQPHAGSKPQNSASAISPTHPRSASADVSTAGLPAEIVAAERALRRGAEASQGNSRAGVLLAVLDATRALGALDLQRLRLSPAVPSRDSSSRN